MITEYPAEKITIFCVCFVKQNKLNWTDCHAIKTDMPVYRRHPLQADVKYGHKLVRKVQMFCFYKKT